MITNKEVEAFYKDLLKEGELDENESKLLESILSKEKNAKQFENGIKSFRRMQSGLDDLRTQKEKLEADFSKKIADVESLRTTLSTGDDLTKREKEALKASLKARETQLFNLAQELKQYANGDEILTKFGLDDPTKIPSFKEPTEPAKPRQEPVLDIEALKKEIFGQQSQTTEALANWPVDLLKIERKYKQLYGTDLDLDDFKQKAIQYKGDYWKAFNEEYKIPDKEKERETANLRASIEKELKEKYDREYSSRLLPGGQTTQESPFYNAIAKSIPEEAKKEIGQMSAGIADRNTVLNDAVNDFAARLEKKTAA